MGETERLMEESSIIGQWWTDLGILILLFRISLLKK